MAQEQDDALSLVSWDAKTQTSSSMVFPVKKRQNSHWMGVGCNKWVVATWCMRAGLDHLNMSTCTGSWAGVLETRNLLHQTLSWLRCCKLSTASTNEYCNIIQRSIFNTRCDRKNEKINSPHNRFYRYVGKENNPCLQGGDFVCQLPASARLHTPCCPHVPQEWKWKPLCWALAVQVDTRESFFCQYLAGASSCFTAAVEHIGALSPYNAPGTDWIGICGVFF